MEILVLNESINGMLVIDIFGEISRQYLCTLIEEIMKIQCYKILNTIQMSHVHTCNKCIVGCTTISAVETSYRPGGLYIMLSQNPAHHTSTVTHVYILAVVSEKGKSLFQPLLGHFLFEKMSNVSFHYMTA